MKKIIKYILLAILLASSIFSLYYLTKMNILHDDVLRNIYIFVIFMFLITLIVFLTNKRVLKIIFTVISVILIILYSTICIYANNTINYINNITTIKYELVKYTVVTLKDSNISDIKDLNNKKIGFIKEDKYIKKVSSTLNSKIKYETIKNDEIGTLMGNLYENNIDAFVVNEAYMTILEESENEFLNNYKEVYSFDIKVDNKDLSTNTNSLTDPFIIYISGTDSRYGINSVARSDVNIVMVVNPKVNKILLISIPRDYYVQLHDTYGLKDKLTHAGVYGINKSVTTIEDLLSININNYIKVSFDTVINLVDVIDGIDIYSDTTFNAYAEGTKHLCSYIEGTQHVNGECALRFARERKTYLTGDRHRGQNQQEVITAVINKLTNPKYLIRYNSILESTKDTIETNLSYDQITSFAKHELSNMKKWSVESISLDGTGAMLPTYSMGSNLNLYVMIPDENTINIAKQKINEYLNY